MNVFKSRWTLFWMSAFLTFIKILVEVSYGQFLIEFTRSFPSAKMSMLQWMGSIVAATETIFTWTTLIMIALFRYRVSLLIGVLLGMLGLLMTSLALNEFQVLVSYSIFAYGAIFITNVGLFLVAAVFPPNDRYHIFTTSFKLSVYPLAVATTPITNVLINNFGWRLTYVIYATIILIQGSLVSYIFVNYKEAEKKIDDTPLNLFKSPRQVKITIVVIAIGLAAAGFCRGIFINLPIYIMPKHSITVGLSLKQGISLVSYFGIAEGCTHIAVALVADIIFKKKLLHLQAVCCLIATFITLFIGYQANTYEQLTLYVILMGVTTGALAVGRYAFCSEALYGYYINELFSIVNFAWGVGFLIGMLIDGVIFDLTDSYQDVFILMAAMQLSTALFISVVIVLRSSLYSFLVEETSLKYH